MSTSRARDIEALRIQVAQLTERLAVLEQQSRRPTDGDLIAAIAAATKGHIFSARELHRHARRVDEELRSIFDSIDADSPIRVGKLLRRLSGVVCDGYRLTRVMRDARGVVWECRVSEADLHGVYSRRTDKGA